MKILFAGDFRWNGGSSHTIRSYADIAPQLNCSVRVSSQYGSLDGEVPKYITVCEDDRWADHVVLVFESFQYLTDEQRRRLCARFGPSRITVVDPDGRYGPTVCAGGDSNHREYSADSWRRLYESLSETILQPRLGELPVGATFYPYFCLPSYKGGQSSDQIYAVQYVGNCWYRWGTVKRFLEDLSPARHRIGRIAFCGQRWRGGVEPGFENDLVSDPTFLAKHGVELLDSVPFGHVVDAMSRACISPIFVRPMISAQRLITPRMFETLCANTIPVFLETDRYISRLFGDGSSALCLGGLPGESIVRVLETPEEFLAVARVIRQRLEESCSTKKVFSRLLELIEGGAKA